MISSKYLKFDQKLRITSIQVIIFLIQGYNDDLFKTTNTINANTEGYIKNYNNLEFEKIHYKNYD
jgi:hypothetical protein